MKVSEVDWLELNMCSSTLFLARAVGVAVGLRSLEWPSSKRQIMKDSEVDWLELKICSSTLFLARAVGVAVGRRSGGRLAMPHLVLHLIKLNYIRF